MRAAMWHGPGDVRLQDVPEPGEPGPGQALIAVRYCGICGTDLHEFTEGPVMIRPGAHPLTGARPPLVLGHELSGTVLAVGAGGPRDLVGRRVTADPCWSCGTCFWCLRGDYHICRIGGSVGLASDGALAPLVLVPAQGLVPLPDAVSDQTAALAEPLAVGLHAVRRGGVGVGDRVLVLGAGPIGAAVILAARAAGAAEIYVSEPAAAGGTWPSDSARRWRSTPAPVMSGVRCSCAAGASALTWCSSAPACLPWPGRRSRPRAGAARSCCSESATARRN